MALASGGTITAAYPVTAVVVPATLLAPGRWRQITMVTALGSALGGTALVIALHHLGWAQIYDRFPERFVNGIAGFLKFRSNRNDR